MQIVPSTKHIPTSPGFVEALKHGRRREAANLNVFKDLFPRRFDVNDEFVTNPLLDLRLIPLFMVKHFVITLDPNDPERGASKEVPNFDHFAILFGNSFPEQNLLPIEHEEMKGENRPLVIAELAKFGK